MGLNEVISRGEFLTYPGNWKFNTVTRQDLAELAAILTELAGKPVVHREDTSIQHWIYDFLSKIDTVSTSEDLERFMGCPVTPLMDSILPFINPK